MGAPPRGGPSRGLQAADEQPALSHRRRQAALVLLKDSAQLAAVRLRNPLHLRRRRGGVGRADGDGVPYKLPATSYQLRVTSSPLRGTSYRMPSDGLLSVDVHDAGGPRHDWQR